MSDHQMLEEHRRTWSGFVKLIVWSSAATIVTLVLLALFFL